MKNPDSWRPSKFQYTRGRLRASRNPSQVGISSRLVADIVAMHYEVYLKDHASGSLIDLGCGEVPLYETYKDLVTSILCADWLNSKHANRHLDVTCDLNETLPFESGTFNTVLLSDVLEHVAQPSGLWLEMGRILQPGGKVILNVPFLYKIHEAPHDYFRYTRYALENFATASGFKVLLLKEMGGLPEVLADLSAKMVVGAPVIGKISAEFLQRLCLLFLRTRAGKTLSARTSIHFPLGYFMVAEKAPN